MIKNIKERMIGITGSISGITSIFGSWQVCHSICLGLIAVLGILGITITGMPFAFLTKIAVPLWTITFILLLIIIGLYIKKKCISKNMIMFNSGILIAGIPFAPLQNYSLFLWIIGGTLVSISVYTFIKNKIQARKVTQK